MQGAKRALQPALAEAPGVRGGGGGGEDSGLAALRELCGGGGGAPPLLYFATAVGGAPAANAPGPGVGSGACMDAAAAVQWCRDA